MFSLIYSEGPTATVKMSLGTKFQFEECQLQRKFFACFFFPVDLQCIWGYTILYTGNELKYLKNILF